MTTPSSPFDRRQLDHEMKDRMDRLEEAQKAQGEMIQSIQGSVSDILEIVDAGKAFFHLVGWLVTIISKAAKLFAPIVAFIASAWAFWQHFFGRSPH